MEKLPEDLRILRAYQPDFAENLQRIVCEEELSDVNLSDEEGPTIAERPAEVEHCLDRVGEELRIEVDESEIDPKSEPEPEEKGNSQGQDPAEGELKEEHDDDYHPQNEEEET